MIIEVLLTLLGEALIFGSALIFIEVLVFLVMNHIWFLKWEESDLERRCGTEYLMYMTEGPKVDSSLVCMEP
jgi:protein-S-isoprenylcysteine O-methyltransferase Ste14